MQCPFPGMDPYIERPQIWPDFHDSLVTYISAALQPQLRPRYAALIQRRLYVIEHRRPIRPDVSIVRTPLGEGGVAVATQPDRPLVMEFVDEEITQPVIHIIEPAAGNRIVTAIEVLSPDNKDPAPGRDSYLDKQDELWHADSHLVEIDLLHCCVTTNRRLAICPRMMRRGVGSGWRRLAECSPRPTISHAPAPQGSRCRQLAHSDLQEQSSTDGRARARMTGNSPKPKTTAGGPSVAGITGGHSRSPSVPRLCHPCFSFT